ncbi:MAG: hypothetical protein ABS46_00805 [Cytophagaceae bacterium SCN 52-12]|nr:MAG: hypothetical protein ABS46_00805 [Cytophagaceae bacterium SCN 52-12]
MNFEDLIGLSAGLLTSTAMVPQLTKVLKTRETENLSVAMILVLIAGVGLWTYYGILKSELPIILSNGFSVLINLALLACALIFKKE